MDNSELMKDLLNFIQKEKTLQQVCEEFDIKPEQVLDIIYKAREASINVVYRKWKDDIFMINQGDIMFNKENTYSLSTDDNHEFKFIAISDLLLGSKSQQLSILNDVYQKGYEMGYNNVLLCGNISAGVYSTSDMYKDSNYLDDTFDQVNYITKYYPKVDGINTYFITGKVDDKHLKKYKVDIGKRISDIRDDMIYLGNNSCDINIDKVKLQLLASKLAKTYTVSYRTEQQIDSYRSEDKPNILVMGGLLQMEKYNYRDVTCISVPSLCATTREMNDKRYANTIGAWYITIKTNERGFLESVQAFNSPYYISDKYDYLKAKPLVISEDKKLILKRGE